MSTFNNLLFALIFALSFGLIFLGVILLIHFNSLIGLPIAAVGALIFFKDLQ